MRTRRMIKSAGKSSYISPNRGLALLDEAIQQIELQQNRGTNSEWDQCFYRCKSGMCLAGWAAQLAGGQWAFPIKHDYADMLLATDDDNPEDIEQEEGLRVVDAHSRAARLMGLDDYQACEFFSAGNDLDYIRALRAELASGELVSVD